MIHHLERLESRQLLDESGGGELSPGGAVSLTDMKAIHRANTGDSFTVAVQQFSGRH